MARDTTIRTSVKKGCVRIALDSGEGKELAAILIAPQYARVIAELLLKEAALADDQMPEAC